MATKIPTTKHKMKHERKWPDYTEGVIVTDTTVL